MVRYGSVRFNIVWFSMVEYGSVEQYGSVVQHGSTEKYGMGYH